MTTIERLLHNDFIETAPGGVEQSQWLVACGLAGAVAAAEAGVHLRYDNFQLTAMAWSIDESTDTARGLFNWEKWKIHVGHYESKVTTYKMIQQFKRQLWLRMNIDRHQIEGTRGVQQ